MARMAANGTTEFQRVGKTSKTYSMKGKERKLHQEKEKQGPHLISYQFFIMQRKRSTRLVLISCKYSVDKKTNKNCFMLFARKNLISVGVIILIIGNGPTRRQVVKRLKWLS
ncbi:hypothetical protein CsSME_00016536 [Camellia sinensis var. sinensis]